MGAQEPAEPAVAVQEVPWQDGARFLTSFGWFVLGASTILGWVLDRHHTVTQVVRIAALLVLAGALVVSLRARLWRYAAGAALGCAGGLLVQVASS